MYASKINDSVRKQETYLMVFKIGVKNLKLRKKNLICLLSEKYYSRKSEK